MLHAVLASKDSPLVTALQGTFYKPIHYQQLPAMMHPVVRYNCLHNTLTQHIQKTCPVSPGDPVHEPGYEAM